jgi:hypothetical protein
MRRCAAGWDTACNRDLSILNKVANTFEHALSSANIPANPFQPDALELLIQAEGGLPRTINHLAQRAMEAGAAQSSASILWCTPSLETNMRQPLSKWTHCTTKQRERSARCDNCASPLTTCADRLEAVYIFN